MKQNYSARWESDLDNTWSYRKLLITEVWDWNKYTPCNIQSCSSFLRRLPWSNTKQLGCHYLIHKFTCFILTNMEQLVTVCSNLYGKIERAVFFFINVLVLGQWNSTDVHWPRIWLPGAQVLTGFAVLCLVDGLFPCCHVPGRAAGSVPAEEEPCVRGLLSAHTHQLHAP